EDDLDPVRRLDAEDGLSRGLRPWRDDAQLLADQRIQQGRLPGVRPARERHVARALFRPGSSLRLLAAHAPTLEGQANLRQATARPAPDRPPTATLSAAARERARGRNRGVCGLEEWGVVGRGEE